MIRIRISGSYGILGVNRIKELIINLYVFGISKTINGLRPGKQTIWIDAQLSLRPSHWFRNIGTTISYIYFFFQLFCLYNSLCFDLLEL